MDLTTTSRPGDGKKPRTYRVMVDPMTVALALGLLGPAALMDLEEDGCELAPLPCASCDCGRATG